MTLCITGSQGCGVYTSVWFYRTTTKSSSVIDFYRVSSLGDGVYGMTTFFSGSGTNSVQIYPYNTPQNWTWAKIQIAVPLCDYGGIYALTNTQKLAMVEHEIGHAFGLAHVNSINVLMYPYANTCTATHPTADDCNGVNYLYGGYNP